MSGYKTENIPEVLKKHNNWIIWHFEERENNGKITKTKVPYMGINPMKHAESNNSATWCDFRMVDMILSKNKDGIGYVFDGSGVWGIDLDNAFNTDGTIFEPYRVILDNIQSYTERSPGNGLHIIFQCDEEPYIKGNSKQWIVDDLKREVALFGKGKYFTFTGNVYDNRYGIINISKETIINTLSPFFKQEEKIPKITKNDEIYLIDGEFTDDKVIEMCSNAANHLKFKSLWRGSNAGYASNSEADLALTSIMAFYTQDILQLQRLLRRSGLQREKMDRADYMVNTINKVLLSQRETYKQSYNNKRKKATDLFKKLTGKEYKR